MFKNHVHVTAKFLSVWALGAGFYYLASVFGFWGYTSIFVIFPPSLLVLHFIFKKVLKWHGLFALPFEAKVLVRVKYLTFCTQNAVIMYGYWQKDAEFMSAVMTWAYRANIFEVLVDFVARKRFTYVPASVLLLLPYHHFAYDERYVLRSTNLTLNFVGLYTMWFFGFMGYQLEGRWVSVMHTLFPLMAPVEYWFSVRTFTGMYMLVIVYFKPVHRYLIDMKPNISIKTWNHFMYVYDVIFFVCFTLFCAKWVFYPGTYSAT